MRARLAALFCALPSLCAGQSLDLSAEERAAFGAEIRALLLDEPEIVANALNRARPTAGAIYQDSIDSDLALIEAHAAYLFSDSDATILGITGPIAMASFADPDSATADMLTDFAEAHGIRIALRDPETQQDLLTTLGLDTAPAHVFPTLMVRGDVPAIVLARYLPRHPD